MTAGSGAREMLGRPLLALHPRAGHRPQELDATFDHLQ